MDVELALVTAIATAADGRDVGMGMEACAACAASVASAAALPSSALPSSAIKDDSEDDDAPREST